MELARKSSASAAITDLSSAQPPVRTGAHAGRGPSSIPSAAESGFSDDTEELAGNLNPEDVVLLRFECLSAKELKLIAVVMKALLCAAILALILLGIFKSLWKYDDARWLGPDVSIADVCISSVCLIIMGSTLALGAERIWAARHTKKHWGMRRRRLLGMALLQLTLQVVKPFPFLNSIFWLVPNLYILATRCGWFDRPVVVSSILRWSLWNMMFMLLVIEAHQVNPWLSKGRPVPFARDALILDAPWILHWPMAVVWALAQICIFIELGFWLRVPYRPVHRADGVQSWSEYCLPPNSVRVAQSLFVGFCAAFLLLYLFFVALAGCRLARLRSGSRYRVGNILHLWQQRLQEWNSLAILVTMTAASYSTQASACANYVVSWLGILPMQLVLTATVVGNALLMYPITSMDTHMVVQGWLQILCWSEASLPAEISKRDACLPPSHQKEPMFCLETAVKLLAFSWVVYQDTADSVASSPARRCNTLACDGEVPCLGDQQLQDALSQLRKQEELAALTKAMSMYGLQHFHIVHEEDPDTKALIAWNSSTLVLAFRGTASMKNVFHDLQAWRAPHVPERAVSWLEGRPMVHKGFLRSWAHKGYGKKVLDFIADRVLSDVERGPAASLNVYVTGHSLGGALATLAAYDLQQRFAFRSIRTYTYGAPRTGNRAFARAYEAHVPETWHVILDRDIVPRVGKFFCLYKRPGCRVLLEQSSGTVVVRPSPFEIHVRPGRHSVRQHFLAAYRAALLGVLRAQFSAAKRFRGGREGALHLAADPHMAAYLHSSGLDLRALQAQQEEAEAEAEASEVSSDWAEDSSVEGRRSWLQRVGALASELLGASLESRLLLRSMREDANIGRTPSARSEV